MHTHEIYQEFEKIVSELRGIEGLPEESVVQVAQVILQETGKDRRSELLRDVKAGNNGAGYNESFPATDRQKNAMKRFGIEYDDDITKSEAYLLLQKAFGQLHSQAS